MPRLLACVLLAGIALPASAAPTPPPGLPPKAVAATTAALLARHGPAEKERIERGVAQAAQRWRPADGDAAAFQALALEQFAPAGPALDTVFHRLEGALEQLEGHAVAVNRELSRNADLDLGPLAPVDPLLKGWDASAHLADDLFASRLAFVALLNFPLTTLQQRLEAGEGWSRRQWAEARLAGRFAQRVPADVNLKLARAFADAELYISDYNLHVHHLLGPGGERLFPPGKRLLSHWNLRDELKAQYEQPGGLARQRLLAAAMERIVTQTIPRAAVDDPTVDWDPVSNAVRPAPAASIESKAAPRATVDGAREPDTRYARLLAVFQAEREVDPHTPATPTFLRRKFEVERELPEARVVALLEAVLGSSEVKRTAALVRERLGRPLEAFDVWYPGFRPPAGKPEAELDALTRARYPTPAAFAADLPRILGVLGFTPQQAAYFAAHIEVDPARGSGHALAASLRGDRPHLRTRVGAGGMDYKGFNIAVHELGHNVEQVSSLEKVDSTLLAGVPNTAFTEALAFVFQARDLQVLGLPPPTPEAERLAALERLWGTYEIAGVGLVDLEAWRWMYQHPTATPAQLKEAVVRIAVETWNRWYAPVLGVKDSPLLAIYSHLISSGLYLPDYPLGHLIQAQVEAHLAGLPRERLGPEFERMAAFGSVAPDLWMKHATGTPVSAEPLLAAARAALDAARAP